MHAVAASQPLRHQPAQNLETTTRGVRSRATFCSIAVGRTSNNVHFGFYWGNELADPDKILLGDGNQYRYILVPDKNNFPKAYIEKLVKEAYANSLAKVKDKKQIMNGQTIVKSISSKKREKKTKSVKTKKK